MLHSIGALPIVTSRSNFKTQRSMDISNVSLAGSRIKGASAPSFESLNLNTLNDGGLLSKHYYCFAIAERIGFLRSLAIGLKSISKVRWLAFFVSLGKQFTED